MTDDEVEDLLIEIQHSKCKAIKMKAAADHAAEKYFNLLWEADKIIVKPEFQHLQKEEHKKYA